MLNIFQKTKHQTKKALFSLGLFLAVFFLFFWGLNFNLDYAKPETVQEKILNDLNSQEKIQENLDLEKTATTNFQNWTQIYSLSGKNVFDEDADGDGLSNYQEFLHLTDPKNSDSDQDGFSDYREIINGFDPDAPGDAKPTVEISISKIKVNAPMIWSVSEDEKQALKDLENGLSHYPKTAAPGQIGNAVISGHSSNYVWAKGEYNHIFSELNDLEVGDVVTVKFVQQNGRVIFFRYVVKEKFVAYPSDERIFAEADRSILTLTTCWPIGTTLKRVIIKAELVK